MPYIEKMVHKKWKGVKNVQKTSPRGLWMLPLLSAYFSSFRILNCHAFDSAEMKIGQMKKVPLGLWEVEQITGHIVRERILFFSVHHFKSWAAPKRATNKSDLSSFSEGVRNTSRNSARKHFKNQIFFCYIVLSLSLCSLLVSKLAWDKRLSGNSASLKY